ncbi:MAG: response regulator [Rhodospirillum sp.]|nr:response regulator [Rhodospirillum sp.]MCF8502542.1 response regulator [Rhodospirillum sp.]
MNQLKSRERTIREVSKATARVLVVDDGITQRMFYRSVLETAGFVVEEAVNGMEGYEMALIHPFDLLIVDINMPKMDGYAMMRMIRSDAAVRMVPAVMVSTEGEASDVVKAFEAGANYYLQKPVQPDELTDVARMIAGVAL